MFLDANIFIHYWDTSGPRSLPCHALLRSVLDGKKRATTSWLVINEVIHFYVRTKRAGTALRILESIRAIPSLEILPIDDSVALHLPKFLRAGLDASDAFHAAVMKANYISVICSYDREFDKINDIRRVEPE